MPKCTDGECYKTVENLDKYVFGEKPGSEIRTCMLKLVPKTWLWTFLIVFGVSFIGGGVTLYSDVQGGKKDHAQSVKEDAEMKEDIKEIKAKGEERDKKLTRIETLQETVLEGIGQIQRKLGD